MRRLTALCQSPALGILPAMAAVSKYLSICINLITRQIGN